LSDAAMANPVPWSPVGRFWRIWNALPSRVWSPTVIVSVLADLCRLRDVDVEVDVEVDVWRHGLRGRGWEGVPVWWWCRVWPDVGERKSVTGWLYRKRSIALRSGSRRSADLAIGQGVHIRLRYWGNAPSCPERTASHAFGGLVHELSFWRKWRLFIVPSTVLVVSRWLRWVHEERMENGNISRKARGRRAEPEWPEFLRRAVRVHVLGERSRFR
jgi:hypothetical protein